MTLNHHCPESSTKNPIWTVGFSLIFLRSCWFVSQDIILLVVTITNRFQYKLSIIKMVLTQMARPDVINHIIPFLFLFCFVGVQHTNHQTNKTKKKSFCFQTESGKPQILHSLSLSMNLFFFPLTIYFDFLQIYISRVLCSLLLFLPKVTNL